MVPRRFCKGLVSPTRPIWPFHHHWISRSLHIVNNSGLSLNARSNLNLDSQCLGELRKRLDCFLILLYQNPRRVSGNCFSKLEPSLAGAWLTRCCAPSPGKVGAELPLCGAHSWRAAKLSKEGLPNRIHEKLSSIPHPMYPWHISALD